MTEIPVPLKDIKIGAKIIGEVAKSTLEPAKGPLKRYVQLKISKLLSRK